MGSEKLMWEYLTAYLRPLTTYAPRTSAVAFWVNVHWSSEAELPSEVFPRGRKGDPAYQGLFRQVPSPYPLWEYLFYSPPTSPHGKRVTQDIISGREGKSIEVTILCFSYFLTQNQCTLEIFQGLNAKDLELCLPL